MIQESVDLPLSPRCQMKSLLAAELATLFSNLLTSMFCAMPCETHRCWHMTHQPSIDVSALWQAQQTVFTIRSSPKHKHTCTEIQGKCCTFTAWIWPSVIVHVQAHAHSHVSAHSAGLIQHSSLTGSLSLRPHWAKQMNEGVHALLQSGSESLL